MANCPKCGTFNWDEQTVCGSCGTDLFPDKTKSTESGPEGSESGSQRPEPKPLHKRTHIGQKRPKITSDMPLPGSQGKSRIGQRRGTPDGDASIPFTEQNEASTIRRTRVGQRRGGLDMDSGTSAGGIRRRSYTDTYTIGEMFSEAFKIMVKNPIVLVPSLIPVGWSVTAAAAGIIGFAGLSELGDDDVEWDTIITGFALWAILSMLISFWSYAATIRMIAMSSEKKGVKLLLDGVITSLERTFTLLIGGIVFSIIVVVGGLFFFIPGLIAFLLMIMFVQAIMIDNKGPIGSLSKSMEVVRANLGSAIVIFLAVMVIPIMIEVQSALVAVLPLWATWGNILAALFALIIQVYIVSLATVFYTSRR